jgi:type IV pilus assembly protein PilA
MLKQIDTSVRRRAGFTLVELMIVVAIIGVLCAVAVPNFLAYQARSRRSEAYTNLSALARAEKAYQAERNDFVDVVDATGEATVPDPTVYGGLGTTTMPWDATATSLSDRLGWAPEGQVFYTYEVNNGQFGAACSCTLCFTATAHGDVDGNAGWSALMYVHPQSDTAGNVTGECPSYVGSLGTPTRVEGGNTVPVYDEVAVQPLTDQY